MGTRNYEKKKVLCVGAGGIGCELLKNLVLSGFKCIEVIDLDTIEVSNLNRQFLFRKEHVGKSKAEIAKESVLRFSNDVTITAYHDSIISEKYGVSFFKQFDIILNALDNHAARMHVNRMCLAAEVPLIESGTAGYFGQVVPILKGMSACYECIPAPHQKTFPACTIRNTPSEPIHCIIWAKFLFNQLFGEADADEDVAPDTEDPELATSGCGDDAKPAVAAAKESTRQWAERIDYDPERLLSKLYREDVRYLLSMEVLWKNRNDRRAPDPLPEDLKDDGVVASEGLRDQRQWSVGECARVFKESVQQLRDRYRASNSECGLVWDKDDTEMMDFVAAAANLRCHVFHMSLSTRFKIKSMAGNVIPAIATTNAIIASMIVLQAMKVLDGKREECRAVYLRRQPNVSHKVIVPTDLPLANPKCYVCASGASCFLKCNAQRLLVRDLRDRVLKKALGMVEPDVEIDGKATILITSEEDCMDESVLDKPLSEFGLGDFSRLRCDDFLQHYSLVLTVSHTDEPFPEGIDFQLTGDLEEVRASARAETNGANGVSTSKNDAVAAEVEKMDDEPVIIGIGEELDPSPSKKRRVDGDSRSSDAVAQKRPREETIEEDEVQLID